MFGACQAVSPGMVSIVPEAQAVANEIIKNAFPNLTYFSGDYTALEVAVAGNE